MKTERLANVLASCLDSIERGERTPEECLALYPEYRDELDKLFRSLAMVREGANFAPRPGFHHFSRARLMRRLDARTSRQNRQQIGDWVQSIRTGFSRNIVVRWAIFLVLIISMFGSGTVYASQFTLPGDALYPVKLSVERMRLSISDDPQKVLLAIEFIQKRVEEIRTLIAQQREDALPLGVSLLANHIVTATEAMTSVAQEDPPLAASLALQLERALLLQTEALTQQLGMASNEAKPSIEKAILASQEGQEAVKNILLDALPPASAPPQAVDTPADNRSTPTASPPTEKTESPPQGQPPDQRPASVTPPAGGPPKEVPGPPSSPPGSRP